MAPACFHCGLPVPAHGRRRVPVLGAERDFCCAGCAAVASTIAAGGFEGYYATRSAPGSKPGEFAAASDYDDLQAQKQFAVAVGPHQRSATLILDRIRCAACLWLNEQALRRLPGVLRADVNYTTRRAQVAWDPGRTRLSDVIEAIRAIGYDGWVTIELYPYVDDPDRAARTALDRVRDILAKK